MAWVKGFFFVQACMQHVVAYVCTGKNMPYSEQHTYLHKATPTDKTSVISIILDSATTAQKKINKRSSLIVCHLMSVCLLIQNLAQSSSLVK